MTHPHFNTRHLALVTALALAACGGSGDGGQPASNKSGDTTSSPSTSTADENMTTKAPGSPPIDSNGIRGDVLIQALLTTTNTRDDANRLVLSRLEPENITHGRPGHLPEIQPTQLRSPWVAVSNQITADASAGLGSNVLELSVRPGPIKGVKGFQNDIFSLGTSTARLGVSAPGVSMGGNALAAIAGQPLQIGQQMKLSIQNDPFLYASASSEMMTAPWEIPLVSDKALSIAQDTVIPFSPDPTTLHSWTSSRHHPPSPPGLFSLSGFAASLSVSKLGGDNQFDVCLQFGQNYDGWITRICNAWEVPAGWTPGQSLKHLWTSHQGISENGHLDTSTVHHWSTKTGPRIVREDELSRTSVPLNDSGISGALLAALFDAWTPRAQGMQGLPPHASAAADPIRNTPASQEPARVSVLQESRATQYEDGATTGAYSPATGSYLHAVQLGVYQGPDASRVPTAEFPQLTLALHMSRQADGSFTLPRWTGASLRDADQNGEQRWLEQSEQLSDGRSQKTIRPDDLILFGSAVQFWREPHSENYKGSYVLLSIEQTRPDKRSVDVCWTHDAIVHQRANMKICSLFNIPENWQPGQPLRPTGYQVNANGYWTTSAAAN
ncbi:MAG: hypothetical protein Q4D19_05625 [Lautropia sp.]|nr:hypothetical protein [Lautropia sp.]